MEIFFLVVGAIIALLVVWAFVFDRRHRGSPLASHSIAAQVKRTRIKDEQHGSEWGAGG